MNRKKRIRRQELRAAEVTPVVAEIKKAKPKVKPKVEAEIEVEAEIKDEFISEQLEKE